MPRHEDLPFSPLPGRGASESDLFDAIIYQVFTLLRVAIPATVKAWSPAVPGTLPATVDIELDFLRARAIDNESEVQTSKGEVFVDETAGPKAVGPWPRFVRVPIVYPGGPSFGIRGPIDVGTTGLYIIADRCIDQWLNTGGPLDPAVAVKHDINDGFFLAGSAYHGRNSPPIPTDVHRLGRDDGSAGFELSIEDASIRMYTDGPTATVDALTNILLGPAAVLGVARLTDPVGPSLAMSAWASMIEAAIVGAGGVIPPGTNFALTVLNSFASITGASTKTLSE
jgi:hypothetical protein